MKDAQTWVDRQYTELEAEIEAEGRRFWGWLFYRRARIRRERSLSAALHGSSETRILLIGDPGSGKSVALRRIAYRSADAAARARFRRRPIPFYVNLRTLRSDGRAVDASLIRDHVLAEVNPKTNNDLRRFLDEQFDEGVLRGEWLFLFDSFDEIPDILRATDSDAVVRDYSDAIAEFLSPFNRCRAVVASREFRAPQASRIHLHAAMRRAARRAERWNRLKRPASGVTPCVSRWARSFSSGRVIRRLVSFSSKLNEAAARRAPRS